MNLTENIQKRSIACLIFLGVLPFALNGFYNPLLEQSPFLYWIVEILTWIVLPTVLCGFGIKRKLFTYQEIGFHTAIAGQKNLLLFTATLIVVPMILRWTYLASLSAGRDLFPINYGAVAFDYKNVVPASGYGHFLATFYFSLTAGVIEEVFYRGMFHRVFESNKSNHILYVIVSSLVFASVHWEGGIQRIFLAFCFGLVASTLYVKIKNLWPLVAGHFLNDFLWLV